MDYQKVLACLHGYLNTALELMKKIYQWTTEEYVSGHIYLRKMQRVVCTQVHRKEGYEDIKNIMLFILGYIFIKFFCGIICGKSFVV